MNTTKYSDTTPLLNTSELKQRGWTDTAIKRFLRHPDKVGKPRGRRKGRVYLYLLDRVQRVESTAEFQAFRAASQKRSAAAKQSAERQRHATLAKVAARLDSIRLDPAYCGLQREDLVRQATQSFVDLEQRRAARRKGYTPTPLPGPGAPRFWDKICVNFLRHEATIYDNELDKYFNATGVGFAVDMVRERVYECIAQEYPFLSGECELQLAIRRRKEQRKRGVDVSQRHVLS